MHSGSCHFTSLPYSLWPSLTTSTMPAAATSKATRTTTCAIYSMTTSSARRSRTIYAPATGYFLGTMRPGLALHGRCSESLFGRLLLVSSIAASGTGRCEQGILHHQRSPTPRQAVRPEPRRESAQMRTGPSKESSAWLPPKESTPPGAASTFPRTPDDRPDHRRPGAAAVSGR